MSSHPSPNYLSVLNFVFTDVHTPLFPKKDLLVPLLPLSAMESHSLLNPHLHRSDGVFSSFRTTWQEFVEDLGFWRVLFLLLFIALLSLAIAYYVSGVLPFSSNQLELVR